jgi:serine/threonine protein phosphatase 1
MSRYAVSDIHGCLKTFKYLLEKELQLKPTDTLYLLGDYIDRGPDSKGVLDYIMELQKEGFSLKALRGNHEEMLLQSRTDPAYLSTWLFNGGKETLESFKVTTPQQVPEEYSDWMENLKFFIALDDYLLVHAGFNFQAPDPFADTEAMLWTRSFEPDKALLGTRKIIHGHTPVSLDQMATKVASPDFNVLSIDAGCVYTGRFGHLAALDLDSLELVVVPNKE